MPAPPESVAFSYDGVDTVTATVTNATPGDVYLLFTSPFGGTDFETAVGTTVVLSVLAGGSDPGDIFEAHVVNDTEHPDDFDYIAWTLYKRGTVAETAFDAAWDYDGDKIVTVMFPDSDALVTYVLEVSDETNGVTDSTPTVGTGGDLMLSVVLANTPTPDHFRASLGDDTFESSGYRSVRLFSPGVAGAGFPGNPGARRPIAPPTQVFGGNRFYEAPIWRQIVTDLDSRTLTFLDRLGLDRSITVTRAASRVQTVRVPSDNPEVNIPAPDPDSPPFVSEGTRFLYSFRREAPGGSASPWVVRAAGIVLEVNDEADSDHATSIVTAYDPWKYLYRRPVLLDDGTLPGDDGRVYPAGTTADEIIIGQLSIAEATGGTVFTDYDSTGFYAGTIETTDPLPDDGDGLAITFARGATLGEMLDTLVATGTCDVVFDPIYDPVNRPGILCELSIYRKAGEFRPNAIFGWDKWPRNVVQLSRQIDGTGRANRIQMFAGQGGPPVPEQSDAASIAEFGEYWALQYLPGVPSIGAAKTIAQRQLALLKNGAYTYALSPAAERAPLLFQEYREADTVTLHADRRFRDPIVGVPIRVESIPIVVGDDQLERVNQMLVSFSPETGS